jgi:hypothetical protein
MGAIEATGATAGLRTVRPAVAAIHPVAVVVIPVVVVTARFEQQVDGRGSEGRGEKGVLTGAPLFLPSELKFLWSRVCRAIRIRTIIITAVLVLVS